MKKKINHIIWRLPSVIRQIIGKLTGWVLVRFVIIDEYKQNHISLTPAGFTVGGKIIKSHGELFWVRVSNHQDRVKLTAIGKD